MCEKRGEEKGKGEGWKKEGRRGEGERRRGRRG
jgi:hypothetical protein